MRDILVKPVGAGAGWWDEQLSEEKLQKAIEDAAKRTRARWRKQQETAAKTLRGEGFRKAGAQKKTRRQKRKRGNIADATPT